MMKKIFHIFIFCFSFLFFLILYPFGKLIYSKKNIWLFCERGNDANDNSYYFFKWVNENHPEITSFYLISKKSLDYDKVKTSGKCISYKSLKHWLVFIGSKVRLSTHLYSYAPEKYLGAFFMKKKKAKGIDVFLQHGVTHNWQDCFLKKNNTSDLIICAARPEYDYLLKEFDLGRDVLKLTGFPRYDTLQNSKQKSNKILIMPTWRRWLANLKFDEFKSSEYFRRWHSLLQNNEFICFLKQGNLVCNFFLHPSFAKYRSLFNDIDSNFINVIVDCKNIQNLFIDSRLLITDYSSVLFDYAYLRKPTIYYHFDENDFYSKQYEHGFFRIDMNGFGPVVYNEEQLVLTVNNIAAENYDVDRKYLERINNFFNFNDDKSNERVFNEVQRKLSEKS